MNGLKLFFEMLFAPKYKLKGGCNRCGACCRNILFYIGDKSIKTEAEFNRLKSWKRSYHHFSIEGKDPDGNLLFRCKSLTNDNKCSVYFFRSLACRAYPALNKKFFAPNAAPLETCGFYTEPEKPFKSYLD